MITLIYILIASLVTSLCSLVAIITLSIKEKVLNKILLFLVSLSAGALMGGAFIHLLPEALEKFPNANLFSVILISFITFFIIEKILHWRHCHEEHCNLHTFGHMNLVGDGVHNFIDGLIIASTFMININLGLITTLAVCLHEIPQEIGDFGVLVYAGFTKKKAFLTNFLVALISVIGGFAGYFLSFYNHNFISFLLPFAAGGFIYIAASDLIPEIRKEQDLKKSMVSFGVFLMGVLIMYLFKLLGD